MIKMVIGLEFGCRRNIEDIKLRGCKEVL